jgi:PAS domain S-box-containing protein
MLEHELTPECRSIFQQSARLARLGVFILDLAADRCVYCSDELARMHGLSSAACLELIGTEARLALIHEGDRERYRAVLADARARQAQYQVEYRMHDAAGDLLHLREMAEQVAGEGGTLRLVGCVQDLSEPKRIEATLQQVNQTLEGRVAERTAELRAAKEAA